MLRKHYSERVKDKYNGISANGKYINIPAGSGSKIVNTETNECLGTLDVSCII